jgi:DNA polymerase III epsilon subunit-like protein
MNFALKVGWKKINNMDEHLSRYDKNKTFVFIDCESLNLCLNFCHNLPWQIAMIKIQGDKKIDQKNFYLKWDTNLKISQDAARITRYDHKKVQKEGYDPKEIFPTIKDWLDNADHIVGHNILGYDIYLIKEYYQYMNCNWKYLVNKIVDTNLIAKGIKNNIIYNRNDSFLEYQYKVYHLKRKKALRTSLSSVAKENGIEHDYDSLHDAISDLDLNVKVWHKLKWQVDI